MTTAGEWAARFLRQRAELGAGPVVLERLTAVEALEWARRAREAGAVRGNPGLPPANSQRLLAGPEARRADGPEVRAAPENTDSGVPEDGSLPPDHEALRGVCLACTRCRLAEGRTQVVFADGNPAARVMVVGEAPGANEDATGLPFVGAAGKLLDLLLASVDLSRKDSVYICNVIKCRPPGNRNPRPDEIETCSPYLRAQIRAVQPEVILAVGTFAGQLLTGEGARLGRLRGKIHAYEGTPMVVTYHPAALLRNSGWTRATWDDLQLLRHVLDEL